MANLEVGIGGTTTLTPGVGVTSATLNLIGALTTWNISTGTGVTTTVDNTVAGANNLTPDTAGGNIIVDSSVLSVGALGTVAAPINGGSFAVDASLITAGVINSESVTFGASGGKYIVGTTGSFLPLNLLSGFSPVMLNNTSDVIDDASLAFGTGTTLSYTISVAGANDQVVLGNGTNSFTFDIAGTSLTAGTYNTLTGGPLHLSADGTGIDVTLCYVGGTRIATPHGEALVESLQPGDLVLVQSGEQMLAQPVKWVGQRRIALSAHPRPETVAPIRIQKGAFADNVPHRNLLVSPDHAILVDGKLICARQLVNGTTIRREQCIAAVDYFHVELEQHSILLAEGLTAESYLDTGNRGFFEGSEEPFVLHPDLTDESDRSDRAAASCAPFVWDEASVQPVWEALSQRAVAMGQPVPVPDTTKEPELCIIVQGRMVRPMNVAGDVHIFVVPKGTREVRVVSRAAQPTDSRPWMEDRRRLGDSRRLGVYVERITLRGWDEVENISIDHPDLAQGWWDVERGDFGLRRWTDGNARLPLPAMAAPAILEIRASASGMRHLTNAEADRRAA
jgi:hypothetical protein